MSKIRKMREALSDAALADLARQGSDRIGYVVQTQDARILTEFRVHGVIGKNDGLTIVGAALAGQVQEALQDSMF